MMLWLFLQLHYCALHPSLCFQSCIQSSIIKLHLRINDCTESVLKASQWFLPVFSLMCFISCSSGLKTSGGVLFLVSVTCFLALLSVNSDMILFHYLLAGFNCLQVSCSLPSGMSSTAHCWPSALRLLSNSQGPFVFFFRIVFNKEARNAMKYCCSRKRPDHMLKSKASVSLSPEN